MDHQTSRYRHSDGSPDFSISSLGSIIAADLPLVDLADLIFLYASWPVYETSGTVVLIWNWKLLAHSARIKEYLTPLMPSIDLIHGDFGLPCIKVPLVVCIQFNFDTVVGSFDWCSAMSTLMMAANRVLAGWHNWNLVILVRSTLICHCWAISLRIKKGRQYFDVQKSWGRESCHPENKNRRTCTHVHFIDILCAHFVCTLHAHYMCVNSSSLLHSLANAAAGENRAIRSAWILVQFRSVCWRSKPSNSSGSQLEIKALWW